MGTMRRWWIALSVLLTACGGPIGRADAAADGEADWPDDGGELPDASDPDASTDAGHGIADSGPDDAGLADGGPDSGPEPLRIVKLADHCALRSDGEVRCWGEGREGQLGDGMLTSSDRAVRANLPGPATDVACSLYHCCAIVSGETWCWGEDHLGQCGIMTTSLSFPYNVPSPVRVTGYSGVAVHIGAGEGSTCVIDDAGDAWCWGTWINQEPDATQHVARRFELIGANDPEAVVAANGTACAIATRTDTGDRGAWCWGENDRGQSGASENVFQDAGSWVHACDDIMRTPYNTYCASDGELYCWGRAFANDCLDADVVLGPIPGITDVAATRANCFLHSDGSFECIAAVSGTNTFDGMPGAFDIGSGPVVTDGTGVYLGGTPIAGVMD